MWRITFLFLLCFQYSDAVIYTLNQSEFARMPPVFHLDKYEQCLYENNASGVYCHAKFDLVTDEPSNLYNMIQMAQDDECYSRLGRIASKLMTPSWANHVACYHGENTRCSVLFVLRLQEYSARRETHLNHTQLSYGICLTRTCKNLYENSTTGDRKTILEACLNETLWRDYKLKAKINHEFSCTTAQDKSNIDKLDIIVAVVLLAILGFTLIESFREIYHGTDKCPQGKDFLSCYSISQNWAKLTAPPDGPDPRLSKLRFFQGSKCIVTVVVFMVHSLYAMFVSNSNTQILDKLYNVKFYQMLANGSVAMQAFFSTSGFLLAYNFEILTEKRRITSAWIPLAILHRWFKLFAPYAVVVAVYATWYRHFGSGPLWQSVVVSEVDACRNGWWKNLLFINNYIDETSKTCMASTWYLATDIQLYILGVLLLVLTSGLRRKILLSILVLTGVMATAAVTYYEDLDGVLLFTPEAVRNEFLQDRTCNLVYRRTHTNLVGYFMGVAAGLATYHLSKDEEKLQKYPFMKFRYLGLVIYLSNYFLTWCNIIMYPEGPRPTLLQRAAYSVISKLAISVMYNLHLMSMVLIANDKCKDLMTWSGWAVPSRVAYSAYLVHLLIIKVLTGSRTTLLVTSNFNLWQIKLGSLSLIFVGAILFHLLVEAPLNQLMKIYMSLPKDVKKENADKRQLTVERTEKDQEYFKEVAAAEHSNAKLKEN